MLWRLFIILFETTGSLKTINSEIIHQMLKPKLKTTRHSKLADKINVGTFNNFCGLKHFSLCSIRLLARINHKSIYFTQLR